MTQEWAGSLVQQLATSNHHVSSPELPHLYTLPLVTFAAQTFLLTIRFPAVACSVRPGWRDVRVRSVTPAAALSQVKNDRSAGADDVHPAPQRPHDLHVGESEDVEVVVERDGRGATGSAASLPVG